MFFRQIRALAIFFLWFQAVVLPLTAESFASIRLDPRAAPEGFENAARYEVTYLTPNGDELDEVDLSIDAKIKDMDLLLAGITRELLAKEYEAKGATVEVHQVLPTTPEEILTLAATTFPDGSLAWAPENQKWLAQYAGNDSASLHLYKMEARVATPDGIAEQTVPLLLRFKHCPAQKDLLTLFFVTTCKSSPATAEPTPAAPATDGTPNP